MKHALHTSWFFSAAQRKHNGTLGERRALPAFSWIEDYWAQLSRQSPPHKMATNLTLYLFRSGIEPRWEDTPDGGAWSVTLSQESTTADQLDACWEAVMLAVLGEQLDLRRTAAGDEEVLGCALSKRKSHAKIAVWTRHAADEAVQCAIARRLRELSFGFTDSQLSYVPFSASKQSAARRTSGAGAAESEPPLYVEEPLAAATGNAIDCTDATEPRAEASGWSAHDVSIRQTPHAGRGVFAARPLAAGTTILSEAPLRAASGAELARIAGKDVLNGLCGDDATSKIAQNHFAHENDVLLFVNISLLNHSCLPNASIQFDECGNGAVILARDIAADEEITFCYSAAALFADREVRQKELASRWGFECKCKRCVGSLKESEAGMWRMLEAASLSAQDAKPRGPIVDPSIATQQRDALAVLEASLPHLVERERFRFDAEYFTV